MWVRIDQGRRVGRRSIGRGHAHLGPPVGALDVQPGVERPSAASLEHVQGPAPGQVADDGDVAPPAVGLAPERGLLIEA